MDMEVYNFFRGTWQYILVNLFLNEGPYRVHFGQPFFTTRAGEKMIAAQLSG
jgi:hypothetical protein